MTNIVDFQNAFNERKDYVARKDTIDRSLQQNSQLAFDFFRDIQTSLDADFCDTRTLKLFFEILHTAFTQDAFKEGSLMFGGAFAPNSIYVGEESGNSALCLSLSNRYVTDKVPECSVTFFALGTKEGIRSALGYDVDQHIANSGAHRSSITDPKEARTIIYDYVYNHPDVDTKRDVGVASLPAYQAAGMLVEKGYVLTDYAYSVERDPDTQRKILHELIVEFVHPNPAQYTEKIYLYFDYEASMKVIELMMQQLFGVGEDFRGPDSLKED
jgi:hypothetical protein